MPIFLSEEEFELCRHDSALVAEKADLFVKDLHRQLETVRAESDAASIAAEHTCSVLEQRYAALSADCAKLQAENAGLTASFEQRLSELAEAQAEKHNLHLKAISKDGEIERLNVEVSELHKSKRQLLELVEQKDTEINEKSMTIQSYLDKIIQLTDSLALKETRVQENDAELARCRSECSRFSQEKELISKHNEWLNGELTEKVTNLIEIRRTQIEYEAETSAKISDLETQLSESSKKLRRSEERVRELESRVKSLEEDMYTSKDAAAANEDRFAAELATVTKLVELHKESSEEWSRKSGELEGVIKALEMHLSQVENDYKEKLDKELLSKKELEKEFLNLKEKCEKYEAELEKNRKTDELYLLPLTGVQHDVTIGEWIDVSDEQSDGSNMIVPRIPVGVSGTALAASLLRSGWSLAKMYEKYQEASDALRHERWERKHSEAILERVLHEIEEKAGLILDERVQHEKMVEAYSLMNQKLQHALSVHDSYERTIRTLKVELKRSERDFSIAQKEINDLQKQVAILLKECRDIQFRCGVSLAPVDLSTSTAIETSSPEQLLTFKDIHGIVEQNAQLRFLVAKLSNEEEVREAELKEEFQSQLQKVTDEAASKVEAVLKRSEEQGQMIGSLHNAVAMYKRLYDEERRSSSSLISSTPESITVSAEGRDDLLRLFEGSQESTKRRHDQLVERIRSLEDDLTASRNDLSAIRLERDKMILEANFAKERLESFIKEFEHQRDQMNGILSRNVELTQLIVDYQRKLRESSESVQTAEEQARKLSMEVSILEREKEILVSSEKVASGEVRSLSERVHRLQTTLDTIQSSDEVREDARRMEKIKLEEHAKQIEREWAEAKKELQEERVRVRKLTDEREKVLENSLSQVEETSKQLAEAWKAVASAESRAAVAEARCSDLESIIKRQQKGGPDGRIDNSLSSADANTSDLWKEEMNKLKEEAEANKSYMLQYKEIAHTNEVALKNMESAHEKFKAEAEKHKKALEEEILSLRQRIAELERDYMEKSNEVSSAVIAKEDALNSASDEIQRLKFENSVNMSQIMEMEVEISSLKKSLEEEHQRWRNSQNNYERQVILLSETIQEMTKTSEALALAQNELSAVQKLSDEQRAEYERLKSSWETEKLTLQQSKDLAEKKNHEIDEQNKILHNRLESMHVKLAELEHVSSSIGLKSSSSETPGESDLQVVINYLRRSKEIAETEVSLLKQEKLRLKSQLDAALKASESAQNILRAERENARKSMFSDEEFKSLQIQVREINLLRESNSQLREENKYNFEECQKLRENAQKANTEAEKLADSLREKDGEIILYQKRVEGLNAEKSHLEEQIIELRESSQKVVDLTVHEQLKEELHQLEVKLGEKDDEIESAKKTVSEKQEYALQLQKEIVKFKMDLDEQEKKIAELQKSEESRKAEVEKQKKFASMLKKRAEVVVKEKEELLKEKQTLQTQIEELKTAKKSAGDGTSEQAMKEKEKEKDARIQMLERILEREREDLKKEREDNKREKLKRQKMEATIVGTLRVVNTERKKLEDEMEKHRQSISSSLEISGVAASQIPAQTAMDEQTAVYIQAINKFEELASSAVTEKPRASPPPYQEPPSDISLDAPAPSISLSAPGQPEKGADQRERRPILPRPITDARKRKLVRPSLAKSLEQAADVDMSESEGTVERQKSVEVQDQQEGQDSQLARKRGASFLTPEPKEEISGQQEESVKRVKPSEILPETETPVETEEHQLETEVIDFLETQAEHGEEPPVAVEFETKAEEEQPLGEEREGEELAGEVEVGEEEKEEGEMQTDAPEIVTDEADLDAPLSEEAPEGEGLFLSLPESEKTERSENSEEVPAETLEEKVDNDPEPVSGTLTSTSVQSEGNLEAESSSSTGKGVSEEAEKSGKSRTIILTDRAKERALMRQAGMGIIPTPARGRGRAAGTIFRRDLRAPRGGRTGRGQSSGEKDQG